ncbi:MAG: hypothetical protein HOP23_05635 [Methylococcaceae bacterium]|nr:hypothetical protein [Methylococcaceae bacterium]
MSHPISPAPSTNRGRTNTEQQCQINTKSSGYQCVITILEANVQRQLELIARLKSLHGVRHG